MTEPKASNSALPIRWALGGGSAGVGAVFAYGLVAVMKSDPHMVIQMIGQWGPMFAIAAGLLYVVDRRAEQFVSVTRQTAESQQALADAVQQIATRDDREQYEQRVLLGHVGSTMEKVLDRLDVIDRGINSKASGASA